MLFAGVLALIVGAVTTSPAVLAVGGIFLLTGLIFAGTIDPWLADFYRRRRQRRTGASSV